MPDFRVDGKIALVTGCSKGIGLAVAVALAGSGADIIGVSGSLAGSGGGVGSQGGVGSKSEAARAVEAEGRKFYAYSADLSNRDSLNSFITKVRAGHPRIDILINNAGRIIRKPAAEHADEYWDPIIDLNLNAPFILTREIGRGMLEKKSGKIVFTCSLLSFQGGLNVPGYAASKGAIASLLKAFANEWAGSGITVNGVAPGYIVTDNTAALRADPERDRAILSRIPAGRWGEVSDLTGAYVFLSSPASDYVNGSVLTVDGGWMGR